MVACIIMTVQVDSQNLSLSFVSLKCVFLSLVPLAGEFHSLRTLDSVFSCSASRNESDIMQ